MPNTVKKNPTGIAVAGVTASGKSDLAVLLAQRHNGEVVSCDSMLVYRGCDVGTAKPTEEEKGGIAHHLIDILDPATPFSSADFVAAAEKCEAEITARHRLPILCGGTGLYLDAFLRGGFDDAAPRSEELRARLNAEAERFGNAAMHARLAEIDPASAAQIHENNRRRVLRALEIYELTGETKSELDRRSPQHVAVRDYPTVALYYEDKELRDRVTEARVRKMFERGLAEETARLRREGVFDVCRAAAQAIGYKELFPYLDGAESREDAILRLTVATRRYAKRQLTWYRAVPYIRFLAVDAGGKRKDAETLVREAERLLFDEE